MNLHWVRSNILSVISLREFPEVFFAQPSHKGCCLRLLREPAPLANTLCFCRAPSNQALWFRTTTIPPHLPLHCSPAPSQSISGHSSTHGMMQHLGPETALMGLGMLLGFRIFAAGGWLEANIPVELQSSVSTQTLMYHASASHCMATAIMYGTAHEGSARRVELKIFAAGGQHPATTSKHRISATASISCAPASRRVAAAEAITRCIEIPMFAARGQRPTTTSKQHIPSNDWIPRVPASRRGAAAEAITRRIEIPRAGQIRILPPEANAPLRLQTAAERRYIDSKSRKQGFFVNFLPPEAKTTKIFNVACSHS
ncbi:hypothetical protein C8R43DRAFT_1111892 [Mycena crocata]|nr:hypothetical protein C8R43DRAFT_1111892 [Mycena crocata]